MADVRRAHETMMVEKGDTMNRLSRALEESQAQCRHLMATNNVQEVSRLQAQLRITMEEKEELSKTVQDLQVNIVYDGLLFFFLRSIDKSTFIF